MRKRVRTFCLGTLVALLTVGAAGQSMAEVAILALDALSFISFDDEVTRSIGGGTIRFNFGPKNADGSVPFTIDPDDVVLSPLSVDASSDGVQYGLAGRATGTMFSTSDGRKIVLSGVFVAQDLGGEVPGARNYSVSFSTETATAKNGDGTVSVSRQGARIAPGARYVQLVGATVNRSDHLNGAAVYIVLSGTFDRLP